MDKQTKLLLGLALVATGGYLLWQQTQKKKSFAGVGTRQKLQMTGGVKSDHKLLGSGGTFASMSGGVQGDRQLLSMTGGVKGDRELLSMTGGVKGDRELLSMSGTNPVGRRMRMSGGAIKVQQSTFNASGAPYAGAGDGFFNVQDSGWQGFAGDQFFDVTDSGWQG